MKDNHLASLVSIALGILILLHHLFSFGRILDVEDILHHEFFAGVSIAFGIGALLFRIKGNH